MKTLTKMSEKFSLVRNLNLLMPLEQTDGTWNRIRIAIGKIMDFFLPSPRFLY